MEEKVKEVGRDWYADDKPRGKEDKGWQTKSWAMENTAKG